MQIMLGALFVLLATASSFAADLLYNAHEAQALLGYDPGITLIKEEDSTVVRSSRKTVYFHGLGGNKNAASAIKQHYGSKRLPGDIITFNFADANYGTMDYTQSSLGQWHDIRVALYVLKALHDAGEKEVGVNAHSRGGAAAVNMVAVLLDATGQYDARLSELGIDQTKRKGIVNMLRNGHMILECPLISVRGVIRHHFKESAALEWLRALIPSASIDASTISSATSVDYSTSLILKKYRPWAEQAVHSADAWQGARIPTFIHFQERDEVLGNEMDEEFYAKLYRANGEQYTRAHLGYDGGHNSSFESFNFERNLFLKEHHASYKRCQPALTGMTTGYPVPATTIDE